jgi:hypothetical protein
MRKVIISIALVTAIFFTFQACGPNSDFAKSREIVNAVVATPPVRYVAGEVSRPNWLSTSGDGQNFRLLYSKSLTTESVDSECSYLISWATSLGATKFRDGDADGNIPLTMLSGNEIKAQQTCVEVLSLVDMDPGIESGSAVWQMFGNHNSDDVSTVDFGINLHHSYDREADKTELIHNMNMDFFTMLGLTP